MLQSNGYLGETRPKIYGVEFSSYFNGISSGTNTELSTKGIRLYDATGYRFVRGSEDTSEIDSFSANEATPFAIRECVTVYDSTEKKQKVVAYSDNASWNTLKTNASYNRMIEFPLFYYSRPSRYELRISEDLINGYLPSPMHYRDGILYDKVYITKYAIDSNYMSQSGKTPLTDVSISSVRSSLAANGINLLDYNVYMSLMMLMLVKYANLNIQSVIGNGTGSADSIPTTGGTDEVLGTDGGYGFKSGTGSVITLGIEDLYGKLHHYIDGLSYDSNGMNINEVIENHADTSKYVQLDSSITSSTSDQYVKELAYKPEYPWSFHPNGLINSSTPSIESVLNNGPFGMLFNNSQGSTTGALGFAFCTDSEEIDKGEIL